MNGVNGSSGSRGVALFTPLSLLLILFLGLNNSNPLDPGPHHK